VRDEGQAVNIDGKTIRGNKDGAKQTARHVVSARVGEQHLGLGQVKAEEKGNEITVIPELVALPNLTGATVTIAAMGCQKGIAEYFRWVEEGRYGMSVSRYGRVGARRIMGGYIRGHWSIENELHWV
jgi:hypothetical protein